MSDTSFDGLELTALRFVHTPLVGDKAAAHLQSSGIKFATVEDCVRALLRIITDASINGSISLFPKALHRALLLS